MSITTRRAQWLAAILLGLCAAGALAQEPPAPAPAEPAVPEQTPAEQTPPEQTTVEPAPEPAAETTSEATPAAPAPAAEPAADAAPAGAGAATADTAEPLPGVKRILVLPVEFVVYEKSVAGIEALPNETETAKLALGGAANQFLTQDDRFRIAALPEFQGETAGLLREHVELFKIVANTGLSLVQFGGKAWAEKKTNFDYTIGDGLAFVADASQADYAFIMGGSQIKQTGGSVFMQFLAAAAGYAMPGGGTFLFAGVVDLRTGDVKWLNSRLGMEMFGMTGSDVTKPATALEVVTKMFEGFPAHKVIRFPPF